MQNMKNQMKQMKKINKLYNEVKRLREQVFIKIEKDETDRYIRKTLEDKMMREMEEEYARQSDIKKYDYIHSSIFPHAIINETYDDDDHVCKYCGWHCEVEQSHIEYSMWEGCDYIKNKYDVWRDEDGEIEFKL